MKKGNIKMENYDVAKMIRKNWRKFLRIFRTGTGPHLDHFTNDKIEEYATCHKLVQATIAIVSNYRLGIDVKSEDFSPRGIYKFEGGVMVDGKEIVIKRSNDGSIYCYNDWDDEEKDTSAIVKNVTEEILSIQHYGNVGSAITGYLENNTNIPEGTLCIKISQFVSNPCVGDPLRRLFQTK